MKEDKTMTPYQYRKMRRFWKEWGVSKRDCIEFAGAVALVMLPLVIRWFALFVSMILTA